MGKSAATPEEKKQDTTGFWSRALNFIGDTVIGLAQYGAETVGHMVQIVPASMAFIKSVWSGNKTPQTLKRMKDIVVWDILPYLSIVTALGFLERYIDNHIKSEKLPETWQTRVLLMQSTLLGIQLMQTLLTLRQKSRLIPRVMVTNLTAPARFVEDAPENSREVCEHAFGERLLGTVHGLSAYMLTEALLTILEKTFVQQSMILSGLGLLRAYNAGDIITLPLLLGCQDDKDKFLLNNAPFTLAQGLVHQYLLMDMLCARFARTVGLPAPYIQGVFGPLLINLQTGIAAHMKLPNLKEQKTRWPIAHPFHMLRKASDVGTDILIEGGKKVLPRVFQDDKSIIPWASLYSGWLTAWNDERVHIALDMIVWSGLHRKNVFLDDPVLGQEWVSLRGSVLNILTIALAIYDEHQAAIRAAKAIPKATARIIAAKFGLNSRVLLALIRILSRPGAIEFLRQMQQQLIKAQEAPRIQEVFANMPDTRNIEPPIFAQDAVREGCDSLAVFALADSRDSVAPLSFFRQESAEVAPFVLNVPDEPESSEAARRAVFG